MSLFAVVGVLAAVVLAACGNDDKKAEPTVTRAPATNAPAVTPTAASSPAAASPAAGNPEAASPVAAESPVASPVAQESGSPVSSPAVPTISANSASPVASEVVKEESSITGTTVPSPLPSPATTSAAASPAGSPSASVAVGPATTVDLLDIRFEPAELTIPANTDVTVQLVNKGVTGHTFDIDVLNVHTGEIKPGAITTVTINAAPGEYEYYCAIPGHKPAGMVGRLIVT